LLGDKHFSVRTAAAEALTERQGPGVVEALLRLLRDKDSYVRAAAARALAGHDAPGVVQGLLKRIADESSRVRRSAKVALAPRGEPLILTWACRRTLRALWPWRKTGYDLDWRSDRADIAIFTVDKLYLLLQPDERPRIRRRLAQITRYRN
jgi:hypothetical protein